MKVITRTAGATIVVAAIAGCGGNAASPEGATTVVQPSSSKAQIAVGSANLFGTRTGLNVVATLRTPSGNSVLVTTPTITGPFTLPTTAGAPDAAGTGSTVATGPSASEIATGGIIGGTPQVTPGTPGSSIPATSFGVSGGLFANGFLPANANNRGGSTGAGAIVDTPYTQPLYDTLAKDPNVFTPWGGPPAFDPNGAGQGTRDGTFDGSVLGVTEGIDVFAGVVPHAGTYKLNVIIPTNTSNVTVSSSTTIGAPVALGTVTAPALVPDGKGGGTFAVTLPAGVTDALLQVEDMGSATANSLNCYTNGTPPAYFTIHVTASGTVALPDSDGVGSPTAHNPTICTAAQNTAANGGTATLGDTFTVQLIGADYPIFASNILLTKTQQTPTITGAAGSDDITVSPLSTQTST